MIESSTHRNWLGYACATGAVIVCTLVGFAMESRFDIVNIAMIYLLAVVVVALRFSRGAAIFGAASSVAIFDFVFVPPAWTLTVNDAQYLLTFAIMLIVALVISELIERSRRESFESAKLLVQAEQESIRSTLLASISHDLRTPLSVISGASSSIAHAGGRLSEAERNALAHSIYTKARELSDHVEKVLQMTRLESSGITIEREWCAISEIVGTVLHHLEERLSKHKVLLELPNDLPLVQVDASLLEQVFTNLLENAARHTPEGTIIRIRAAQQDHELLVSIEDFGPGLGEQAIAHIFEKFYRAEREGSVAGVGLGLAICRAIVNLHRGRIWAEQNAQGGCLFHFTIPMTPAPDSPREIL